MQLTPLRTLIPYIAQPLWDNYTFEVAADCWTELLNTFPAFFTPETLVQLVGFLTGQRAHELLSCLVKGDYDQDAVAFSRLLLAYGDVSIQDLAKQPDSPTVQSLMRLLMQLLAYEGFAGAEDDICTPAVEFWQAYTEFLIDSLYAAEDQVEPWMDSARQYVVEVVEQCWVKIRMPPEGVYAEWTSDAKGDFKVFRTDVGTYFPEIPVSICCVSVTSHIDISYPADKVACVGILPLAGSALLGVVVCDQLA